MPRYHEGCRVSEAVDPVTVVVAFLVGIVAGIASGLFGVGGGVIMVPALLFIVEGTTFLVAKAASLAAMMVGTIVGILRHRAKGSVDLARGIVLGAMGAVGAAIAVLLAEGFPEAVLRAAFGVFLVVTGIRMLRSRVPEPRKLTRPVELAITAVTGLAAGVIAGFFGVGGGIVMVPAMVYTGIPIHLAIGTSLVAILINAAAATVTHLELGYWSAVVILAPALAAGAVVGAFMGAGLAHRLNAARLRRAFAGFLILVGASMAVQGWVLL